MTKPKINHKKCTLCCTCVNACPMGLFSKETYVKVLDNTQATRIAVNVRGNCIECGTCESACPNNAIELL